MGNIPSDRNDLLQFARDHFDAWTTHAAAVGITPAMALAVKNGVIDVDAKSADAGIARTASRIATQELSQSFSTLRGAVGDAVRTINAFAGNAANPDTVYNLAQIAPPSPRGPSVPPTAAFELGVNLNPTTGALMLTWKASQPQGVSGVVYNIRRKIAPGTAFVLVGATGEKRFEDMTIPAGTSQVSYYITAQRGALVSEPSTAIDVRFGTAGGGGLFITTSEAPALAA